MDKKIVATPNGSQVLDVTAEDIAVLQEVKNYYDTVTKPNLDAQANAKANGNQKLLDLGLTQAEATALTGYTPPVAE